LQVMVKVMACFLLVIKRFLIAENDEIANNLLIYYNST
jgi:hypothetical protein